MKKQPTLHWLGILLIPLALACGNAPAATDINGTTDDETATTTETGIVRFVIDGTDWVSGPPGHPERGYVVEAITDGATMVNIEAFASDGSYLALTIFRDTGIGPGTYAITETGMRGFYKEDYGGPDAYLTNGMPDNPGSITITSLTDEKVTGAFSFAIRSAGDPENVRQITAGSFDLTFTSY